MRAILFVSITNLLAATNIDAPSLIFDQLQHRKSKYRPPRTQITIAKAQANFSFSVSLYS